MARKYFLSFSLFFFLITAWGQKLKKEDRQLMSNLQAHIAFLSSDALEGRRTGTEGERLAAEYISSAFKGIGLLPKGTAAYYQAFEISEGAQVNTATHLVINEQNLVLHKDFFPLSYSASASLEAMPALALHEEGMPWFINLKDVLEDNKNNPHYDVAEGLKTKASELKAKGATAVIVYNTSSIDDGLAFNGKEAAQPINLPVIYITKEAAKKYLSDETATFDIKLKTDIGPKVRKGMNVIGYLDNGAATTVVLGAHFDHLGRGEDGNSMLRDVKQIHNGADDNASGTAAVIELARLLKASKSKQNNYLFIAFSGEELGLYGSKYFVENPTIDLTKVNYMINMDMVGRLNDSSKTITVGGYGTSPVWGEAYSAKGKNSLYATNLLFKYDSSGTGPSDHTSFYRKDIPVLFYFTGLHSDYHKPTDDFDKINYTGQVNIVKHIMSVVEQTNKRTAKLAFTKTREVQMGTSARFSVTMGIMPDYTFSGAGVRADGISDNRPAQKAGLKTGDIITALNQYKVTSVESYMQALSKFKKGDKATVTYTRERKTFSATVEF
ncbi:MAG TPA: M20/M25/M40 family metallo-hydrolase [Flavisolibacter sp.]|nr:M20/M25/M40 family metallo-hydrolase [Flavisolibacter sp.]